MPDRVPGYGLELPSPGQVCVSVLRVCGQDGTAVWTGVCAEAGVPALAPDYALSELERLAAVLEARTGVLGVVGRALGVRLSTYRVLTSRLPPAPTPAATPRTTPRTTSTTTPTTTLRTP